MLRGPTSAHGSALPLASGLPLFSYRFTQIGSSPGVPQFEVLLSIYSGPLRPQAGQWRRWTKLGGGELILSDLRPCRSKSEDQPWPESGHPPLCINQGFRDFRMT